MNESLADIDARLNLLIKAIGDEKDRTLQRAMMVEAKGLGERRAIVAKREQGG